MKTPKPFHQLISTLGLLLMAQVLPAQVSGVVFRDFNANGIRDVTPPMNEPVVEGVQVQAFDANGNMQTTMTAANGTYAFAGLSLPVRIEFSAWDGQSFPGPKGAGSATSVQFHAAATTTANFGILNPAHYSQTNPPLLTSCFVNGSAVGNTGDAMVRFPYTAGCEDSNLNGTCDPGTGSFLTPAPVEVATAAQIGPTWGLDYHRESSSVFAAAFMKRHVGFKEKGKTGVIFRVQNPHTGTPTITEYADLDALGIPTRPPTGDPHPDDNASVLMWDRDADSWDWVGKMSLGDLDLDEEQENIYVVNLYDRRLYRMPVKDDPVVAADIEGFDIPRPAMADGDNRPFALGVYNGKVYVGVTITNESTVPAWAGGVTTAHLGVRAGLAMHIYEFDPLGNTFSATPVLNASLEYPRLPAIASSFKPSSGHWNPWVPAFVAYDRENAPSGCIGDRAYPQPWLTDIAFDNGQIVLGVRDRFGDQTGYNQLEPSTATVNQSTSCTLNGVAGLFNGVAVGDLLRASQSAGGVWVLENNASSGGITTAGANNGNGPGNGEYYFEHSYDDFHYDIGFGGLLQVPGHRDVAETAYDVINRSNEAYHGGILWHDNTDGRRTRGYLVYNTVPGADPFGNSDYTFAKANGLGDLVAFSELPTLEIGNRVWNDQNNNGIQDPGEPGISAVEVTLWKDDGMGNFNQIAAATTDANGHYYFSSASGTTTGSAIYGVADLLPGMGYELRFPTSVGGFNITLANNGGMDANADARDSDADASGVISFMTAGPGQNNHAFDVGYGCGAPICRSTGVVKN